MPAAGFHPVDRGLKAWAADRGIVDAARGEIEPYAANACLAHRVEIGLGRLVVDHGNAARGRAAGLHTEQRRRIIRAVDARGDDHHALDMQRLVQRRHFLWRCQFRGVDAAREEREFFGIAVDMSVAVAGAGGDVKIDRRRRLRGFGKGVSVRHDHSGGKGGEQNTASRQHRFSPSFSFLCRLCR